MTFLIFPSLENDIFQVQKIMTMISHDPVLLTYYELIVTPK